MMNYILNDNVRVNSMQTYVQGSQRSLYFKRPIVAKIQEMPIHLAPRLQQESQEQLEQPGSMMDIMEDQKMKEIGIQTDYRESEAQTDPYTPKYILREKERPEVLDLQNMKYGVDLPANIDELDMIENNREKTWFEDALPPISDEISFILRRKLMEEQELRDWNNKENEIKKIQNEKLYLLQSGLIEREKDVEEKNSQRIEEIKIKKTESKNRLIAKIQRRKIKVLRKQLKRRKQIDENDNQRNIIEEYSNFGSKVYAGITREGMSLDKLANKFEVQPISLTNYNGIKELQKQLDPKYFEHKVKIPKQVDENKRFQLNSDYTRLELSHQQSLRRADEIIRQKVISKRATQLDEQMRKYSLRNFDQRPPTPLHKHNHIDDDEELIKKLEIKGQKDDNNPYFSIRKRVQIRYSQKELAILLLQRLIRGRSMQNIMYEGKEKRMALIDELLKVADIQDLPEEQTEDILMQIHEEKMKDALLEGLQGEEISKTFDTLSKELLKQIEKIKISKIVGKADEDRRKREFVESGKRQAELIFRQREQVLYDEIMNVHQNTVDNYMNHMINSTIDRTSGRQALIMTDLRKEKIKEPLENYEKRVNNHQTIIRDLVSSFLNPNISRTQVARQIQLEELRFAETSKNVLNESLVNLGNKNKSG